LAGYSSSGGTSSSCTICGDGTYSSAGAASCTQCPSSSYATSMSTGGPGATSSAQCQSSGCSSGYSLSDDKCISNYNKSIKLVQICKPDQTCNYNIPDL
jgi:syndecan 4